jgi:hypothetical protein
MRLLRAAFAGIMSCGMLFTVAAPGGAAGGTSSKTCATYETLQSDFEDLSTSLADGFDETGLEKIGKTFRKAAKKAPKSVKSSLVKLAKFYESLGGFDSSVGALRAYAKNASKYSKAFTKFATYYATNCASAGSSSTSRGNQRTAGRGGDAAVTVAVDGTEYPVTTIQTCDTTGDPQRKSDLTVRGYAKTGERVELTFMHQPADESPSGTDQYYGSLGLSAGSGGQWQIQSSEPWPFLSGDRSSVSGTVTMDDTEGQSVDVTFHVTCS